MCHHIKGFGQTPYLIIGVYYNIRNAEVSLLNLLHRIAELLNRKRDTPCHKSGKKKRDDHQQHCHKDINTLGLPALAQKFPDTGTVHDRPSGLV